MTYLLALALCSVACNVPIFWMLKDRSALYQWNSPRVEVDVADLTFDSIGLVN